ncbi:MAG: secretin N-terminal domain-containing protein [Planctomycetota bacterium]
MNQHYSPRIGLPRCVPGLARPLLGILLVLLTASVTQAADQPAPSEAEHATETPDAADAPESTGKSGESVDEAEPKEPDISVSFQDVEMREIYRFYQRHLEKPILPHNSLGSVRVTIINDKKLPFNEALALIGTALRSQGVIVRETPRHVEFLPIDQLRRFARTVIGPLESVEDADDPSEIVDKVFAVEHYDVIELKDVVLPLLPDYAFVIAEPSVRRLIVTAAVNDLVRIERLVARLDVPEANQTIERIFPLTHGDATEIVAMLRLIISGGMGDGAEAFLGNAGDARNNRGGSNRSRNNNADAANSQTVVLRPNEAPVVLHAEVNRNWVFAVAPPGVMTQIERWINELDRPEDETTPFDLIDVQHADIEEVGEQVTEAIANMADAELRNSVRVVAFPKSRQLLVSGSINGRAMVRTLLEQLDIESSQFQLIREIVLKHDTAENVKSKIEDLFSDQSQGGSFFWFRSSRRNNDDEDVKVTADAQRNTITVMTDPARMRRIETLIAEQWDQPIDYSEAAPKVYTLSYADPALVQELLEDMFNTQTTRTSGAWWDQQTTETSTPVGRLFGQFSFQALKDSNKLIVSTKSAANYVVIDELIAELDTPQVAGLPAVYELKHANAEDLAEQLNAIFSEPGTPSQISRTQRGLSDIARGSTVASNNQNNNNQNNNQNNEQYNPDAMSFWWSQSRPSTTEQPISTLIGKPRFVPVIRRNALMVLAPAAHQEPIRDLIAELDLPGLQVVIHAVLTEVQHDDETTLGLRLAADPSILSDSRLGDQAIGSAFNLNISDTFFEGNGVFDVGFDFNALIQLLIKNLNLRVLNEPRVYTADNMEAHFFDGQDVPTIISDQTGRDSADTLNRSFEYRPVGTRLHVRPHITQEGEVALAVNLELSRIVTGTNVFGNFIFDRRETTTHVVVEDGQTMMISGILNQEDIEEVRKLPLLGDIPLLGMLFRSTDTNVGNREVIAFITPHVIRTGTPEADEQAVENEAWLNEIRGTIRQAEQEAQVEPATAPDAQ